MVRNGIFVEILHNFLIHKHPNVTTLEQEGSIENRSYFALNHFSERTVIDVLIGRNAEECGVRN